jgi:hypothetical protein
MWCQRVVGWIRCMYLVLGAFVLGLAEIHDKGKFGKKSILYVTLAITLWSLKWAFEYTISQSGKPGIDTAAVIAAVMAPIAGLQAACVKYYLGDSADQRRVDAGTSSTDTTIVQKTTGVS